MDLEPLRAEVLDALARLRWQAQDVVDKLVTPTWGGEKHGYDRLLYGTVMSTMALADRLSVYMWGDLARNQTKRLRALFSEMTDDPEAAAVAVQLWRHTLMHFGDPISFTDTGTGRQYSWLLHWGEDHLPRIQHLTFASSNETRVLAFGALHAIDDLNRLAAGLLQRAQNDELVAAHIAEARDDLVERQSRDLAINLAETVSDR